MHGHLNAHVARAWADAAIREGERRRAARAVPDRGSLPRRRLMPVIVVAWMRRRRVAVSVLRRP